MGMKTQGDRVHLIEEVVLVTRRSWRVKEEQEEIESAAAAADEEDGEEERRAMAGHLRQFTFGYWIYLPVCPIFCSNCVQI